MLSAMTSMLLYFSHTENQQQSRSDRNKKQQPHMTSMSSKEAIVHLVLGLLIWPICWGWHAVMTTTTLLDAQHCLYFAITNQGSAAPAKHGRECNLTINSCIPTLWVTALSRSDVAGKHNIWCVCLCLHNMGMISGKDGWQLPCSKAWERSNGQEEQALARLLVMAANAASRSDTTKALCCEVALGVAFMRSCEQTRRPRRQLRHPNRWHHS